MSAAVKEILTAMVLISFAPSLAKTIMAKYQMGPKEILTISTLVVFVLFFAERLWQGGNPFMLFSPSAGTILSCVLGLVFGGALYFYYTALSHGAVTLVVPIWGLQVVGASIVAIVVLQEGLSWQKLLSIAFAVLAIYFATRQ